MSKSRNLDTLERAALGRPVSIGQLYDVKDDTCLKANVFHDKEKIKDFLSTHLINESNINYTLDERFSQRIKELNLENDQKLSLLVDLHENTLPGYFSLLKWRKKTGRVARGTFIYTYFERRGEIDMTQYFNKNTLINYVPHGHFSRATHVISSIVWGHQLIVSLNYPISPADDQKFISKTLSRIMDSIKFSIFDVSALKKVLGETCQFDIEIEVHGDEFDQIFNWNAFNTNFPNIVERISRSKSRPLYFNLYPLSKLKSYKRFLHSSFRSIECHVYSDIEEYFYNIEVAHAQFRDIHNDVIKNSESLICPSGHKLSEIKKISKEIESKMGRKLANLKLNVVNNRKSTGVSSVTGRNILKLKEDFTSLSITNMLTKFQNVIEPLSYVTDFKSRNCTLMSAKELEHNVKTVDECIVLNCYPEHKNIFKSDTWKKNYKYFLKIINMAKNTTSQFDIKIYFAEHKLGKRLPILGSLTTYWPSFEPVWIDHYINGQSVCKNCLEHRDQRLVDLLEKFLPTSSLSAMKETMVKIAYEGENISIQIDSVKTCTTESKYLNANPQKQESSNKINSFQKAGCCTKLESSRNKDEFNYSEILQDIKGPKQDDMECSDGDDRNDINENNTKKEKSHSETQFEKVDELNKIINENNVDDSVDDPTITEILKENDEGEFGNLAHANSAEDLSFTANNENNMETSNEHKENPGNSDITEKLILKNDNFHKDEIQGDTKNNDYSEKYLDESAKNQKKHSDLENIGHSTDDIFQENLLLRNKEPTGHLDSENTQSKSKDTVCKTNNNYKSNKQENKKKGKKGKKQTSQSNTNKSTRSDENAGGNGIYSSKNESSSEEHDSLFSNMFTVSAPSETEVQLKKEQEDVYCFAKCEVEFDLIEFESMEDLEKKYPVLNIMCPAALSNKCKLKLAQVWKCEKCFTNLFYGQNSCIYCQKCGKAPAVNFSFKCSHSSHGDDFFVFEKGDDLLGMLEKLRVKNELNVLILGETGVGKSTFINAFANYLTYDTLEEAQSSELIGLIPTSFTLSDENYEEITVRFGVEDSNEAEEEGASKTQSCKSYVFLCGEKMIRLIDTPGIGDTRGIDQDAKNFVNILSFISNYSSIHGILLLMKPNNSRLSVFFRFCIQELLKHLHKSASENIVFTFTNSKSTFYMPGDTFPPLKRLLGELKDVEIKLNKETIYCLDNDSFRYLVASQNNVKFDDLERKDYSFSWKKSASECERLLGHVAKLKPHSVKETLSINEARRLIISLAQPLGDILMIIHENLFYINAQIEAITACKNNSKKLVNCLFVPVVASLVTYLKDPRTVCQSQICCQKEDTFSICHDPCFLTSVTPNIVNNDALRGCSIFKKDECSKCGCSWKDHMHMCYEIKKIHTRKLDNSAQSSLRNATSRKEKAEETKFALENERMAFLKELDYATKASALFTYFLMTNSITNQTDFLSTYLDHLIRNEKAKENITGAQPGLQAELQKAKTLYEKEVKSLFERKAQITAQEIDVNVTMLYDIPKFGQLFKEIAQQRERDMTNEAALYSEQVFVSKKGSSKLKTFNFDTDL